MSEYDTMDGIASEAAADPVKARKKRRYIDFRDWWEDRVLIQKILVVIGFVLLAVGVLGLFGLVLMLLWNWLMPDIFGLKEISYWQAWGLFILSTLMFKGMGSDDSHRPSDRRRRKRLKRYIQETGADVETDVEADQS